MTEEQRWVVDTNVLVSRLLAPGSAPAKAVDLALGRGVLLASEATLQELADVLGRPKFDPYLSRADRAEFIRRLSGVTRIVPILRKISACGDPRDDKFLDVAVAGDARAIITGDGDLLALHPFHGIAIVTPSYFLAGG